MKHILAGPMIGERHHFSLRVSEQCPVLAGAETSEGGKALARLKVCSVVFQAFHCRFIVSKLGF